MPTEYTHTRLPGLFDLTEALLISAERGEIEREPSSVDGRVRHVISGVSLPDVADASYEGASYMLANLLLPQFPEVQKLIAGGQVAFSSNARDGKKHISYSTPVGFHIDFSAVYDEFEAVKAMFDEGDPKVVPHVEGGFRNPIFIGPIKDKDLMKFEGYLHILTNYELEDDSRLGLKLLDLQNGSYFALADRAQYLSLFARDNFYDPCLKPQQNEWGGNPPAF